MTESQNELNGESNIATSSGSGRMSSEERRLQVIEVAIRLFSKKGFDGTTTKEIADNAGVNPAILFRLFPTKDDLYSSILEFKANEVDLDGSLDKFRLYTERRDDEGLFRLLASQILEFHARNPEFLRLMLYSALKSHDLAENFVRNQSDPVHEFLCHYIVMRQREGAFRDCDPSAAVRLFVGALSHHALLGVLYGQELQKITDEEAIENFTEMLMTVLRNPQPSEATL